MKSTIAEFLGTFFLVLVIGLTVVTPSAGPFAPLAIGMVLMVMVYAGGHVSGAHYNPAVTVAAWLRGKCPAKDVPSYIAAQVSAAVCAAWLVGWLKNGSFVAAAHPDPLRAFAVELVFTFALAFVVLSVATAKAAAGNSYFGLAIGGTVMAAAYAGGAISGGAFNPAVAVGLTVMGLSAPGHLWIFLSANLAGGVLAAFAFRATHPKDS